MATTHRFEVLDGLRGIAAFAVLLKHVSGDGSINPVQHGYLAVDLFFGLSGFVIAIAYDQRLRDGRGTGWFMRTRLIRLYPLILLGLILGILGFARVYPPATLALLFATGAVLLPTPLGAASEGNTAIPGNPPSWSLLWELIANLLYAMVIHRLSDRALGLLLALSAAVLVASAYVLGGLTGGGHWYDAWAAAPRIAFSFTLGLWLARRWRSGRLAHLTMRLPLIVALLCAVLAVPITIAHNWLFDSAVVLLVFPLLLVVGANAPAGRLAPLCAVLGAASYPAYILQGGFVPHLRGLPHRLGLGGELGTLLVAAAALGFVVFAWLILKVYDEPLRRRLTRATQSSRSDAYSNRPRPDPLM